MDDFNVFQTMTTTPRTFPRMELLDVQNNPVDVESLASSHHLILITLKSVQCPICPQLLKILNMYGLDCTTNNFIDPFIHQEWEIDSVRKKFFGLLLKMDAYFIVICPGKIEEVANLQQSTPFMDYPFIAGEQAVTLAKALKIQLSDHEIMPAILEVSKDTLSVDSIYIGRGPGHYFHQFLLKRLIEDRCNLESNGIRCLKDINEMTNQIKRRIVKCQERKMVSSSLSLTSVPALPVQQQASSSTLSTRLSLTLPTKDPPQSSPVSLSPSLSQLPINANDIDINNANVDTLINEKQQTKKQLLNNLPLELLEVIFSSFRDDILSLVKASRTSRAFYIAVCNAVIVSLRNKATTLKQALPQENGKVVWDEAEVTDQSLDRWSNNEEGIPYRDLQGRVLAARELLTNITHWTRHWSPRRLKSSGKPDGGRTM